MALLGALGVKLLADAGRGSCSNDPIMRSKTERTSNGEEHDLPVVQQGR